MDGREITRTQNYFPLNPETHPLKIVHAVYFAGKDDSSVKNSDPETPIPD